MTDPWKSDAEIKAERKRQEILEDKDAGWPDRVAGAAIMVPVGAVIALIPFGMLGLASFPPTGLQWLIMGVGALIGAWVALRFRIIGELVCSILSGIIFWS